MRWLVWGSRMVPWKLLNFVFCLCRLGLVLCNQAFMFLKPKASDGSSVATAKLGLPLWALHTLNALRQFCRERRGGLFVGFGYYCGRSKGRMR